MYAEPAPNSKAAARAPAGLSQVFQGGFLVPSDDRSCAPIRAEDPRAQPADPAVAETHRTHRIRPGRGRPGKQAASSGRQGAGRKQRGARPAPQRAVPAAPAWRSPGGGAWAQAPRSPDPRGGHLFVRNPDTRPGRPAGPARPPPPRQKFLPSPRAAPGFPPEVGNGRSRARTTPGEGTTGAGTLWRRRPK